MARQTHSKAVLNQLRTWLDHHRPRVANASAIICSLVKTAKAHRIERYLWLKRAFDGLPDARTADDF